MTRPGRREGVLARLLAAQTRTWRPVYWLRGGTVRSAARLARDGAAMASLHVDVQDLLADPRSALEYGRVPLGFMDAKHSPLAPRAAVALAAPRAHHVLVMAQTGAGKTDAFTLPAVLSPSLAKTCMVVVDPTGALLNASMAYRAQCGRVSVYDPSGELGLPELSVHWSPLGALNRAVDVTDLEDRALAAALDLVGSQDDAGTTNSRFFALTATSLLRCLLLAAVWDQRQFTAVMGWVSAGASAAQLDEVETILAGYVQAGGGDREVLDAWGGFRALGADRLAERFATAAANLLAFSFASVKASCDLSDPARAFDSAAFLRTPGTHYVVGSSKASERMMGLYVAHLSEIIAAAIDEAKRLKRLHGPDAVLPYQLVLLLEEVAQLASLPNLPQLLSEVRQYGIRIYFVFQEGSISFTVTDTHANESVVPVVFQQGTGLSADRLALNADGTPSEAFGIGGAATFVPVQATGGTISEVGVCTVGATSFQNTNGSATYFYAAGDTFQLQQGTTVTALTLAQFQALLSKGDSVSGYYTPTTGTGPSVFTLTDTAPAAPGTRTATTSTTLGGVDVGWVSTSTNETAQGVTGYSVLRAAAIPPVITGGATTCPTPSTTGTPAAGWTVVKSLVSQPTTAQQSATFIYVSSSGTYTYKDTTASAGTGTPPLQYCYAISSVSPNAAGTTETGVAGATTPPFTAAGVPAAVAGAPAFQANVANTAVAQRVVPTMILPPSLNHARFWVTPDASRRARDCGPSQGWKNSSG